MKSTVEQIYRYEARDGKIFDTEEEARAHENALPDAALCVELVDLAAMYTADYEGTDAESFIDALLKQYNVEKKPVPFTGELRHR